MVYNQGYLNYWPCIFPDESILLLKTIFFRFPSEVKIIA